MLPENDDRYTEDARESNIRARWFMEMHRDRFRCSTCRWWLKDACFISRIDREAIEQASQPSDGSGICLEWED